MSSETTRISEAEKKQLQEISKKTGVSLKKLMDLGAKHVIKEHAEGRFGILLERS